MNFCFFVFFMHFIFFRYGLINKTYVNKTIRWRIQSDVYFLVKALSPDELIAELALDPKVDKVSLLELLSVSYSKFANFIATNLDEYHLFNPEENTSINQKISEAIKENQKLFLFLKFYGIFPHISDIAFLFALAKLLDDFISVIDAYAALWNYK